MLLLKRTLKYGLLFWAVCILLLHSLVPHQHHTNPLSTSRIGTCIPSENGFFGFLGKVFHQDLGDEHLENFKHQNKVDFNLPVLPFQTLLTNEVSITAGEAHDALTISPCQNRIYTHPPISNYSLRGPPQSPVIPVLTINS